MRFRGTWDCFTHIISSIDKKFIELIGYVLGVIIIYVTYPDLWNQLMRSWFWSYDTFNTWPKLFHFSLVCFKEIIIIFSFAFPDLLFGTINSFSYVLWVCVLTRFLFHFKNNLSRWCIILMILFVIHGFKLSLICFLLIFLLGHACTHERRKSLNFSLESMIFWLGHAFIQEVTYVESH